MCIAYIKNSVPVFGIVYLPMTDVHYYANVPNVACKIKNGNLTQIHASKKGIPLKVVVGRYSTSHPQVIQHLKHITQNGRCQISGIGSAIKMCLIAEGKFDYYPGIGTCSEWDTAAAGFILTAAGGNIIDFNGNKMRYNSKNDILSPMFFASGQDLLSRTI